MLDSAEKLAKIISLIAVPVVLFWLGHTYQSADSKEKVAVEYVKLAMSIAKDPNEAHPELLSWASRVLTEYSKVPFSMELQEAVASGKVDLSAVDHSAASTDRAWYAVVGSFATESQARKELLALKSSVPSELAQHDLELHKTVVSGLYAITVGGSATKEEAIRRSLLARSSNWVTDAFAQRDRDWTRLESNQAMQPTGSADG